MEGVLDWLAARFDLFIDTAETARETVTFKLPRVLAEDLAPA